MRKAVKGVSSVIGTFLVLVITVVLFSTVFAWVQTFPTPQPRVNTEFNAEVWYESAGTGYYSNINLTQVAGETNPTSQIRIVIETENGTRFYLTPADGGITGQYWELGMMWKWKSTTLFTIPQNLTVQVINTVKNLLFWQKLIIVNNIWYPPLIQASGSSPNPVVAGNTFRIWADIYDSDLNPDSVYADLTRLNLSIVKLSKVSGSRFETAGLTTFVGAGTYTYTINATDAQAHTTIRKFSMTVVVSAVEVPLPNLVVNQITLNPSSPTRGETVIISAVIKNLQSTPASTANITTTDTILATNATTIIDTQTISVPGYGETEIFITWVAQPGGAHIIGVSITGVMPGNLTGTGRNISVVVMPRVLLVDDDEAGIGSKNDMGANFIAALHAINVNFTATTVNPNSPGPGYDTGPALYQMRNYDVVIWEGGLTNNTLMAADITNLQRFLDNGGKLWLTGANILENISGSFLNTYLGITGVLPATSLPSKIYGTNYGTGWINLTGVNPDINALGFTVTRTLSLPAGTPPLLVNQTGALKFGSQFKRTVGAYESRVVVLSMEFGALKYTGDHAVLAYLIINWLSGINARTGDDLAISSQEISTLTPRYRETLNVSAVVRNNGDTGHSDVEVQMIIYAYGVEVERIWPISGQTIALNPFGDSKTVNFTWTPSIVGIFVLQVMVDPYNKIPETNEKNNVYNNTLLLNQVNVIYTMLVVDDDGSANNGGSLPDTSNEITNAMQYLGYTTGRDMDLQVVPRGADRNNSAYNINKYNCVIWITGTSYNGSGYNTLTSTDINLLQNYYLTDNPRQHSVIIIGTNILNDSTVANTAFMRNILGANNTGAGVSYGPNNTIYGVRESPITNGLEFVLSNTSFTGYSARAYNRTERALPLFWSDAINHWDRITDNVLGTAVLDPAGWHSAFLSINPAYTANRTMIAEIILSIMHWCGRIDAKPEIKITAPDIYAATHSRPYIYLRDLNPQLGATYLLKINITNLGGLSASVTIRFLDGDTVIGARNVNVPPSTVNATGYVSNGKAISEVMWVPLFAGYEVIRVLADPDEIYASNEYIRANNNASQRIQVFFFYDDMEVPERTADNWNHDATLLNINGETPLDFLARRDVSTRVIGDWDWNLSGSINRSGLTLNGNGIYLTNNATVLNYTKGAAHTPPTAYWMPEVPNIAGVTGERPPLDIFLVLDNSGSMAEDPDGDGRTKWQDLVDAVNNSILGYLTDRDYITVIGFGDRNQNLDQVVFDDMGVSSSRYNSDLKSDNGDNEAVRIWVARSLATSATKQTIVNYLTNSTLGMTPILNVRYDTPIWDAIGSGIAYARYYNKTFDFANGIIPSVIVLSDGMDWGKYRGSGAKVGETDLGGNRGPDGGSEFFGPWRAWYLGDLTVDGEITLSADFTTYENWFPVVFSNADKTRWGLIETYNSSDPWVRVPVFTVGLGVTHFEHPSLGKLDTIHYGQEAATPEYWLWRIASTSAAKFSNLSYDGYFYASQSSQLSGIFAAIMASIGAPGDIRAPPPVPDKRAQFSPNAVNTTVLAYDGFEGWPGIWDTGSMVGTWAQSNVQRYKGTYSLRYSGDSTAGNDSIRTASPVTIPADIDWAIVAVYSNYSLAWTNVGTPGNPVYVPKNNWTIEVSTSTTGPWTRVAPYHCFTPLNETTNADDRWAPFSFDITRYKGQSIYIRILMYDTGTSTTEYAYFDEFRVVCGNPQSSGMPGLNYTLPYKRYRFLVTPEMNISSTSNATLSFYTRYSITEGTNGGFIYLWGRFAGESTWRWDGAHRVYIQPKQPYGGNLKFESVGNDTTAGGLDGTTGLIDRYGRLPYWCFNGKSAGGTYGWEKIEADLSRYMGNFTSVRVVFVFAQYGGQIPPNWTADMGWYIDDVQIKVSGIPTDYWQYVYNPGGGYLGSNRYWYYNQASGYLPLGVDSSLYTIPIDLTRAYRATLIAFFKFNINDGAGMPPDGVRIEVSKDNGETWYSITYGVRIGWGYSGRDLTNVETRGYYGVTGDATGGEFPQRYSGVRGTLYKTNWTFVRATDANTVSAYDWVPSFTLVRLNCDLSGFAGNTIILRIRVFTNATGSETSAFHCADATYNRGVFVDNVFVVGTTITHGAAKP
ncbi:MAG: type IV pilin [Thermoplasmata archaeon]|nr:type IV pilin [Thermoplasmata archaeon]